MADFKLLILGPVRLETSDGERLGRLGAKAKALLAYLATQPNGRADREVLAGLLWDCPQAEARHSLRQALLTLRIQLGEDAERVVTSDRNSLQLELNALDVDLLRFDAAIRSSDDKDLTEACRLWRGSFCDGLDVGADPFEEWLLRERAHLDELAAEAFKRAAIAQQSAGRFSDAVNAAQRCVAVNPFDDSAHAALIGLYRQRGWIGPARAAYGRCAELFKRELGEKPDRTVKAALIGEPKPTDGYVSSAFGACSDYSVELVPRALNDRAVSLPNEPVSRTRLLPTPGHNARVIALSAITALVATAALDMFDESGSDNPIVPPSAQASVSLAWVGFSAARPAPLENAQLAVSSPVLSPAKNHMQKVSMQEAISRALELDPDYAYLYPAGC